MKDSRHGVGRVVIAAVIVAAVLLGAVSSYAQDDLSGAKTLYVNASYEEALVLFDKEAAGAGASGTHAAEIHHYRALCLIALGRTAEAEQAIAQSVSADPFNVPDTSELAPRVASVFTSARARLIPDVARAALAEGRQLMQKGDAVAANTRFEAVTKLLSEPGLASRTDLADLTLAANAFAELTRAQITAAKAAAAAATPPPPAPASTPAATNPASAAAGTPASGSSAASPAPAPPAASAAAARPRTTGGTPAQPPPAAVTLRPPGPGAPTANAPAAAATVAPADPGFVAAVPISQALPVWQPENGAVAQLGFSGTVRVMIDAAGKVTGAVMDRSVYPPYDRRVLAAARSWTYRPATRNGEPVPSERVVEIVLRPRTGNE
jgi:TonB family protein